jgi:hypothetical protein
MKPRIALWLAAAPVIVLSPAAAAAQYDQGADPEALVEEALSAAPTSIAEEATVMGWDQTVLHEGTSGWTCFPSPPSMSNAPMCLDGVWVDWAYAWQNQEPVDIDGIGIAYMLQGDDGSSNIDPYAEGPTPDNQWVVEGPHLMVVVPDLSILEGMPTDPENGGPYVMWKGTPYAHIMVPVQ